MPDAIEKLIPHRAPMRFIQALTSCSDELAVATACFGNDDFAVVDGRVLESALVECAAQTVAAALGHLSASGNHPTAGATGMLVAVSDFKIHSRPSAGKTLRIEVRKQRT
ncbi:MAG TPA: hypothetical protein VFV81_07175, partial [Verrucomicrobiae bacterium]|nr:hypothetical protein [Verrucomicrobiae bacterium]